MGISPLLTWQYRCDIRRMGEGMQQRAGSVPFTLLLPISCSITSQMFSSVQVWWLWRLLNYTESFGPWCIALLLLSITRWLIVAINRLWCSDSDWLVIRVQSVPRKQSPQHYTTSMSCCENPQRSAAWEISNILCSYVDVNIKKKLALQSCHMIGWLADCIQSAGVCVCSK